MHFLRLASHFAALAPLLVLLGCLGSPGTKPAPRRNAFLREAKSDHEEEEGGEDDD